MSIDYLTLITIISMALVTYLSRFLGLFIFNYIEPKGHTKEVLEAVPLAVLTAVIAPAALVTGVAETVAAAVTALAATRLPLFWCIVIGVATVILLRSLL